LALNEIEPNAPAAPAGDGPRGRRSTSIVALVVVAALAFAGGVLLSRDGSSPLAPPTSSPMAEPAADVARILLPSTVRIGAGEAVGSGFVYRRGGFVLTAAHLVENHDQVSVRLADGSRIDGEVLGRDPARDVAVIKIDRDDVRPARLARGVRLRVGQLAVAIGSPFGLTNTVTSGIVSAIGRSLPTGSGPVDAIQTDTLLNPGNSGGPLADRFGRVIGINVAVRGRAGDNQVAFAVPIDVAMQAAERLQNGRPAPPVAFIGLVGTEPTTGRAGALVTEVVADSPAAEAGMRTGDLVIAMDRQRIESMEELAAAIRRHEPGDRVRLRVVRDDQARNLTIELVARGS
jgi:S1-C subfamily serine protease